MKVANTCMEKDQVLHLLSECVYVLLNTQIHESQDTCNLTALMKVCVGNETP